MFKIYKQTLRLGQTANQQAPQKKPGNWLMLPAMIAGTVLGTLVFSVVFLAILLPLGFWSYQAYNKAKKATQQQQPDILNAEYTVVSDSESKHD